MRLFEKTKDGGLLSTVWAYWLIEIKPLFSIVLLKFEGDSRECFHTHAFNSMSWLIKGQLLENFTNKEQKKYFPSFKPIITKREPLHKVSSVGNSWVISLRGPWVKTWEEFTEKDGKYALTNGRRKV